MSDFQDLDYYELLGVPRSATQEEIKRAYRREMNKYHPDRFASGSASEQAYAQQRSQRLTEAYAALSDFKTRSTYNTNLTAPSRTARREPGQTPPHARDHQAELYDQAVAHLEAGRTLQAIGALRQLQQINPFYRDSADLLARAEERAHANQPAAKGNNRRRSLVVAGGLGGIAVVGLAAWALAQRGSPQPSSPAQSAAVGNATQAATAMPVPTSVGLQSAVAPTAEPTSAPAVVPTGVATAEPTAVPTEASTAEPTVAPTAEPTVAPTEAATAAPTAEPIAAGRVLFADDFSSGGWADTSGPGWSVGPTRGRYRIAVDPYIGAIWSYRSLRLRNYTMASDVQVTRGEGGLLLSFGNENNYLAYTINPQQTSYRLERRVGDAGEVLAGGQSDAISAGGRATNRIEARINGDTIQLVINGQQVAETSLGGSTNSGRFGLVAISGSGSAEAFFDNLEVREIK